MNIQTPRREVEAYLEEHGWVQGNWGEGQEPRCLHGAIRACCPEAGDAFIIEQVSKRAGRGTEWNDEEGRNFAEILQSLRSEEVWSVTDQDLEDTFGPCWEAVVKIVRQSATMTEEQAKKLADARAADGAARDARDAWSAARAAAWAARDALAASRAAAWAARDALAASSASARLAYRAADGAARDARDALAAARDALAAAWAARDARDAAAGAAMAASVSHLIGDVFTQDHYDTLMGPWQSVFGKFEP